MIRKFCKCSQIQFLRSSKSARVSRTRPYKHLSYCQVSKLHFRILLGQKWKAKLTRLSTTLTTWSPPLKTISLHSRLNSRVSKISLLAMKTILRPWIPSFKRKRESLINTRSKKDESKFWRMNSKTISPKLTRQMIAHILTKSRYLLHLCQRRTKRRKRRVTRSNSLNGLIFQSLMYLKYHR